MRWRAFLLIVGALLFLSSCSPKEGKEYPEQVRENFLTSCGVSGEEERCECVFEEIEDRIPFDEYAELEQEGEQAILDDERFQAAADACV